MGMLFRFDEEIGMCRSVGDWPNGVVIMDMSNPCEPSFAVDWKYPTKTVEEMDALVREEGLDVPEGVTPSIMMPILSENLTDGHMERIQIEDAVAACEGIQEALIMWRIVCHIGSDTAIAAADDPEYAHIFFHIAGFSMYLHKALIDERENRNEDGKRFADD